MNDTKITNENNPFSGGINLFKTRYNISKYALKSISVEIYQKRFFKTDSTLLNYFLYTLFS